MAKIKHQSGFSLIELLVVAALMGMLSIGLVSVFLATFRGSNRAKMEAEIRSQGDMVTTTIERNLRQATEWGDCSDHQTIAYTVNGINHTYIFAPPLITADGGNLFNQDVTMSDPVLTCVPSDGISSGYVIIKFKLEATRLGETVTQNFQTRVAMRNLK